MNTYPTTSHDFRDDFRRASMLIALGWFWSYMGNGVAVFPLQFLLKEDLHLTASALAAFGLFGNLAGYTKPILGVLLDAYPLFGARRRYYLILSAAMSGLLWIALGYVPRTFAVLLATYMILFVFINIVHAVLGGVMVEVGQRYHAAGRLSAQRVALARMEALFAQPLGAWVAKFPFHQVMFLPGIFYLSLVPMLTLWMHEPRVTGVRRNVLEDFGQQLWTLSRSKTLFQAAGAVMLIMLAPGFGTPMLYYQMDTLHFKKEFLGVLALVGGAGGVLGAAVYALICRRFSLRTLLGWCIVIDALGTLFYLGYRSPETALAVTALEGVIQTLAVLPLYDLAVRATPKGSEALGYAIMMSGWNLTAAFSNWFGSYLFDHHGLTFMKLVWLNAGTTGLVLVIVPFLPAALMRRRDGEAAENVLEAEPV